MWFVWHDVAYNVYVFRYAYSQDGQPTIVPKNNKNIKLGQSSSLSRIDKLKINKLYNCGQYQNILSQPPLFQRSYCQTFDFSLSLSAGDADDNWPDWSEV